MSLALSRHGRPEEAAGGSSHDCIRPAPSERRGPKDWDGGLSLGLNVDRATVSLLLGARKTVEQLKRVLPK